MEDVQKEILEVAAICLYLFHGGLWFFTDLGEHILRGSITFFPWCQTGRMKLNFLRLPSSPKGEIAGIMDLVWLYVSDVVLDGNPHGMALIWWKIKKYAGEQFRRCVPAVIPCRDRVQIRGSPIHGVRTPVHTFQGSQAPTRGVSQWYLANSIGLSWFWPAVLIILLLLLSPMILDLRKS